MLENSNGHVPSLQEVPPKPFYWDDSEAKQPEVPPSIRQLIWLGLEWTSVMVGAAALCFEHREVATTAFVLAVYSHLQWRQAQRK